MTAPTTRPRHVVIVGIDGVRFDTLMSINSPAMDTIIDRGFITTVRVNDAGPTVSGPGWTTIFTGVLATDHGIMDNQFSPNHLDKYPDVVHQITQALPDVASYVASSWAPLVKEQDGGPMFRDRGILPPTHSDGENDLDDADDLVSLQCAEFIRDLPADTEAVVVGYFGYTDEVAHAKGLSPEYTAALETADMRLGRIIDAIDARPTRADEDWTLICVTDHGHLDEGGHGGETEIERTAWIAAFGDTVPAEFTLEGLEQADVAGHALSVFGLDPVAPEQTIGRAFGTRDLISAAAE